MHGYGGQVAYRKTEVSTANKSKLILMMYDGAIRFIKEAKAHIAQGDVANRGLYISKAQKIINELQNTLNYEKGGDVANSLRKVYMEVSKDLTDANIRGDSAKLESAIRTLSPIREAWEKIINNGASASPAPQSTPAVRVALSC